MGDVAQCSDGAGWVYSLEAMWAIRSQTRLLYPNSLSYLVEEQGGKQNEQLCIAGNREEEVKVLDAEGVP